MIYRLRNFENNYQILASLGWIFIIIGCVTLFTGPIPGGIILILIGAFFIWFQLRGKRIKVNTKELNVKSGRELIKLQNPEMVYINEVRMGQRVNSRVNSASVKMHFYKGYIKDGEKIILISSNRKETRDWDKLKAIASDLGVEFIRNY